nr:MAG TPA: hypothetical protein [Bacteriophage sp.]
MLSDLRFFIWRRNEKSPLRLNKSMQEVESNKSLL